MCDIDVLKNKFLGEYNQETQKHSKKKANKRATKRATQNTQIINGETLLNRAYLHATGKVIDPLMCGIPQNAQESYEQVLLLAAVYSYDITQHGLELFDYTIESLEHLPYLLDALINIHHDTFPNLTKKLASYILMTLWKNLDCDVILRTDVQDDMPQHALLFFFNTLEVETNGPIPLRFNPYLVAGESLKGNGITMKFNPQVWVDTFKTYFNINIENLFS